MVQFRNVKYGGVTNLEYNSETNVTDPELPVNRHKGKGESPTALVWKEKQGANANLQVKVNHRPSEACRAYFQNMKMTIICVTRNDF